MRAEDWVVEAKAERRQGRLAEACDLYRKAAEAYRAEGNEPKWAHALRHAADLARESGQTDEAARMADEVIRYYRESPPGNLEMGNALRIQALACEAVGERKAALQGWEEARRFYAVDGPNAGVDEADTNIERLRALVE